MANTFEKCIAVDTETTGQTIITLPKEPDEPITITASEPGGNVTVHGGPQTFEVEVGESMKFTPHMMHQWWCYVCDEPHSVYEWLMEEANGHTE